MSGWRSQRDPELLVLIWETGSAMPGEEASLFTAEVIRGTRLVTVVQSSTLEDVELLLRTRYGEPADPREHPAQGLNEAIAHQWVSADACESRSR